MLKRFEAQLLSIKCRLCKVFAVSVRKAINISNLGKTYASSCLSGPPAEIRLQHKDAHNLKRKVGSRFSVGLLFSAPNKLRKLCPMTGPKRKPVRKEAQCRLPIMPSRSRVQNCGFTQGRRIAALTIGYGSTKGHRAASRLAFRCTLQQVRCEPVQKDLTIVGNFKDRVAREVLEVHPLSPLSPRPLSQSVRLALLFVCVYVFLMFELLSE